MQNAVAAAVNAETIPIKIRINFTTPFFFILQHLRDSGKINEDFMHATGIATIIILQTDKKSIEKEKAEHTALLLKAQNSTSSAGIELANEGGLLSGSAVFMLSLIHI